MNYIVVTRILKTKITGKSYKKQWLGYSNDDNIELHQFQNDFYVFLLKEIVIHATIWSLQANDYLKLALY